MVASAFARAFETFGVHVVGVGCGTSLFCIPAVEALHGEGVGWVDGGWMSL
jgi:hypothetical protein